MIDLCMESWRECYSQFYCQCSSLSLAATGVQLVHAINLDASRVCEECQSFPLATEGLSMQLISTWEVGEGVYCTYNQYFPLTLAIGVVGLVRAINLIAL